MNSGLIPGGQILSKRQTVFFTSVDPMNKEHRDPNIIDLEAQVLSNTIERNHPLQHTPSLLYSESCCDENWRNQIRESICVTSTSSEDFL